MPLKEKVFFLIPQHTVYALRSFLTGSKALCECQPGTANHVLDVVFWHVRTMATNKLRIAIQTRFLSLVGMAPMYRAAIFISGVICGHQGDVAMLELLAMTRALATLELYLMLSGARRFALMPCKSAHEKEPGSETRH